MRSISAISSLFSLLFMPATLVALISGVLNAWYFLLPPPAIQAGPVTQADQASDSSGPASRRNPHRS